MTTKSIIRKALCVTILLVAVSDSHAGIALENFSVGTAQKDSSTEKRTWGWQFTPKVSITVEALGAFDFGGDGFSSDRLVGIWESTIGSPLLRSAMVKSSDPIEGNPIKDSMGHEVGVFRYQSIRSLKLTANTLYVIGMTMGEDEFYAINGGVTLNPVFDLTSPDIARDSTGGNSSGALIYPSNHINQIGYFGPNFTFTEGPGVNPVPEPSSLAILGIGSLGLMTARRRRRR